MKVAILHIIEPKTLGTVVEFSTNYKNKKQKTKNKKQRGQIYFYERK